MIRAAELDGAPPVGEGDLAVVGGRLVDGTGGAAARVRDRADPQRFRQRGRRRRSHPRRLPRHRRPWAHGHARPDRRPRAPQQPHAAGPAPRRARLRGERAALRAGSRLPSDARGRHHDGARPRQQRSRVVRPAPRHRGGAVPRAAPRAVRPDRLADLSRRPPLLVDVSPGRRAGRGAQGSARADPTGRRPHQDHDDRRAHRVPRGGRARADDAGGNRGDRRGVAPAGLSRRLARRGPARHRALGRRRRGHDRARRGAAPRAPECSTAWPSGGSCSSRR